MAYCLSYRIADKSANGKSYAERRQQLVDNVYSDNGFWEETTSFIIVNSELSTLAFAEKACTGLSAADDLVIVFDPEDMNAAYFGPLEHEAVLASFFKSLKKLP